MALETILTDLASRVGAEFKSRFVKLASAGQTPVGGHDAAQFQSILDNAYPIESYADFGTYNGRAVGFRIKGKGIAGTAALLAGDTSTAADGCTLWIDASGRRIKRDYTGAIDVRWAGAVADAALIPSGAINAGSNVFTASAGAFKASDVGKSIGIAGAGAAAACLTTTIQQVVSSTQVQLAANASTTVSGQPALANASTQYTGLVIPTPRAAFGTNNSAAFALAAAAAKTAKVPLYKSAGRYAYVARPYWDGITVFGDGTATELVALNAEESAPTVTGYGPALRKIRITSPLAINRGISYDGNGIVFQFATKFLLEDVEVEMCRGAAILFDVCSDGVVVRPRSLKSYADSLHFTNSCRNIDVFSPYNEDGGDDGVAVVSYAGATQHRCENINIYDPHCVRPGARGVSCVGGKKVYFHRPVVEQSVAAGALIAYESSYGTYGCEDVWVFNPTLINCVLNPTIQHGAVLIDGGTGTSQSADGDISNATINSGVLNPVVKGAAPGMRCAVALQGNSINPVCRGGLFMALSRSGSPVHGVEIDCAGAVVEDNFADGISGYQIVLGANASGVVYDRRNNGRNVATFPGLVVVKTWRFYAGAAALQRLVVDGGDLDRGGAADVTPYHLAITDPNMVSIRGLRVDGTAVPDRDLVSQGVTYSAGVYTLALPGNDSVADINLNLAAGNSFALVLSPRHNAELTWQSVLASDQNQWMSRRELMYYAVDAQEGPTGTSGVDYIATGSGVRLQRSSAAGAGGFVKANGSWGAFAMSFDSGAGLVTLTFTPPAGSAVNLRMRLRSVYKNA